MMGKIIMARRQTEGLETLDLSLRAPSMFRLDISARGNPMLYAAIEHEDLTTVLGQALQIYNLKPVGMYQLPNDDNNAYIPLIHKNEKPIIDGCGVVNLQGLVKCVLTESRFPSLLHVAYLKQ